EAHARDLLVVQTLGEVPHELRLTPDRDERLTEQAGRIPGSSLVRLLDLLAEALRTVKDGADARTRLEAALVKAAAPEVDPAARALMARVERLEAALSAAPAPTPPSPPPEPGPTAPVEAAAPAPKATATALAEDPDLDAVRTLWPAVLDAVRADNGLLAACLAEAHPVEVRGSEVVVAFAEHDTFNRKMADGREHRATVDDALRDLAGSSLRVVFELRELEERSEVRPPSEDE